MAGVAAIAGTVVAGAMASEASNKASKRAEKASAGQNELAYTQADIAKLQEAFWEDNYAPEEQRLGQLVKNYGSKIEQDEASADAGAQTARAFDDQAAQLDRNMQQSGNNPADPNYMASRATIATTAAPAIAGAQYWAAKGVRDDAFAKRLAFVQTGRNVPATAMAGLSSASSQLGNIAKTQQDLANQQAVNAATATKSIWDAGVTAFKNWNAPSTPSAFGATGGFKKGGIVEGPMVAALAEDGKPEAVLNAGALKILGRAKVNKLNRMGEQIAKRGLKVDAPRHMSLGEH